MVRDLSVLHTHHINRFEMNLAMCRSNSKKRALVSPIVSFVRRHTVAVCKLPVDFGVKIGEGLPQVCIKLSYAGLVWRCSWLGCVVYKIICEQFFEEFESPLALNFLGVATYNRLRFFRG